MGIFQKDYFNPLDSTRSSQELENIREYSWITTYVITVLVKLFACHSGFVSFKDSKGSIHYLDVEDCSKWLGKHQIAESLESSSSSCCSESSDLVEAIKKVSLFIANEKAALKLQSIFDRKEAERGQEKKKETAIIKAITPFLKDELKKRKKEAAIKIQALGRGFLVRNSEELRNKKNAVMLSDLALVVNKNEKKSFPCQKHFQKIKKDHPPHVNVKPVETKEVPSKKQKQKNDFEAKMNKQFGRKFKKSKKSKSRK